MNKFNTKIPNLWIESHLDILAMYSTEAIYRESPLGMWLNDRNIQYSITQLSNFQQVLELDINQDTTTEFILTWSDILCVN